VGRPFVSGVERGVKDRFLLMIDLNGRTGHDPVTDECRLPSQSCAIGFAQDGLAVATFVR